MKKLVEQMSTYDQYHQQHATKITHYIGVPLVIFSLLIFLGWIHIVVPSIFSIHLAWIATIVALVYYFRLDWQFASVLTVLFVLLNLLAGLFSQPTPNKLGLIAFLVTFIVGWGFQLAGHYIEGKRPALADNLCQAIIAPMYLVAEAFFAMGYRTELQQEIRELTAKNIEK